MLITTSLKSRLDENSRELNLLFVLFQATVMDSPGTYERFLRVLTEARKHDHRQSKVGVVMSGVCD